MIGIPYPPHNCEIEFLEPFPRIESYSYDPHSVKYYIKVSINGLPEEEVRFDSRQQLDTIDYLLQVDRKLTEGLKFGWGSSAQLVGKSKSSSSLLVLVLSPVIPWTSLWRQISISGQ